MLQAMVRSRRMCLTLLRYQRYGGPSASVRRLFTSELETVEKKLQNAEEKLQTAKNELQTAEEKWSNATGSDTKAYYREMMTSAQKMMNSAQKLVYHYTDKVISIDGGNVSGENGRLAAMQAANCKATVTKAQKLMDVLQSSEDLIDCQEIGAGVKRWRLPEGTAWMGLYDDDGRDLYERETGSHILELCNQRLQSETLTGNRGVGIGYVPGIGKTMFLNRLLMEFWWNFPEKPVLFYDDELEQFVLFDWSARHAKPVSYSEATVLTKSVMQQGKLIVLDDPSESQPQRGPSRRGADYFFSCSGTAMSNYYLKAMLKKSGVTEATMDPLTVDEAVAILKEFGVAELDALELYAEWGGSLRHLLAAVRGENARYKTQRQKAFYESGLTGADGISITDLAVLTGDENFPGHFILHDWRTEPDNPESTIEYRPASEHVARLVHESLRRRKPAELAAFINSLNPACPEFWWGFEDLAHVSLSAGGGFDYIPDSSTPSDFAELPLDGFATECSTFPFNYRNKQVKMLFDTAGSAEDAQQEWQAMTPTQKEKMFKMGVDAGYSMKTDSQNQVRAFVHANTATVGFSLPQMRTVHVNAMNDVQSAIREWKDSGAYPRYFKPTKHNFPGIDSFALIPGPGEWHDNFQSQLVVFQIYAGSSTIKHVKQLSELRNQFEQASVLDPEELLNFVLVKPSGQLHNLTTVQFEDCYDKDRVRQWTLVLR